MEIGGQVFERDAPSLTRGRSPPGHGNPLTSLRVNLRVNLYNERSKPRVWVLTCVPPKKRHCSELSSACKPLPHDRASGCKPLAAQKTSKLAFPVDWQSDLFGLAANGMPAVSAVGFAFFWRTGSLLKSGSTGFTGLQETGAIATGIRCRLPPTKSLIGLDACQP